MERILRNLLVNAVEHGEGKDVVVTGPRDRARSPSRSGTTASGLRPGEEQLVFDRFWRADPARARTTGGTGLGLAISLEDARLHGGWLQAWGEPGRGSVFRLTLPRAAGRSSRARRCRSGPTRRRSRPAWRRWNRIRPARSAKWLPVASPGGLWRWLVGARRMCVLAAVVASVAGCVGMPSNGPAGEFNASPESSAPGVNLIGSVPLGPQPGENPSQIVQGFLIAGASYPTYNAAQLYLTSWPSRDGNRASRSTCTAT